MHFKDDDAGTSEAMKRVLFGDHGYAVPVGKTYVVYDGKGRRVTEIKSGQKTTVSTNCVKIKCPPTFGDDVVCWRCDDLAAQQPSAKKPDRGTIPTESISLNFDKLKVPPGKTYIVYDSKRRKIGEFKNEAKGQTWVPIAR